ncbi:hypothetical protein DM02DRAFT_10209 [Periconia macrospinosa]|uniref:Uncharacterized protein n=1 Tax=Periconia macrospinosa TaxID=97972 RepID=A0A2V1EG39_9PLEO|nr:hypothetical protein DM02DRAFT_10209 [Periconia macrospinosa]
MKLCIEVSYSTWKDLLKYLLSVPHVHRRGQAYHISRMAHGGLPEFQSILIGAGVAMHDDLQLITDATHVHLHDLEMLDGRGHQGFLELEGSIKARQGTAHGMAIRFWLGYGLKGEMGMDRYSSTSTASTVASPPGLRPRPRPRPIIHGHPMSFPIK